MFDAALEKRRKHRRDMKNNTVTHNKLDKLVDVTARLELLEGELANVADGKAPQDKLHTRAKWEVIKQRLYNDRMKRVRRPGKKPNGNTRNEKQGGANSSKRGLASELPKGPMWSPPGQFTVVDTRAVLKRS